MPFDASSLPVYYDAWKSGALTTDVLREHIGWIHHLHAVAEHAAMTVEMFGATGFVTDTPETGLPRMLTVYRAQADGWPLGTSWAARYETAEFFRARWVDGWSGIGRPLPFQILTGKAQRSDVLMWSRRAGELVIDPQTVRAIRPADPSTMVPRWAAITPVEYRAISRRIVADMARLWAAVADTNAPQGLIRAVHHDYYQSLSMGRQVGQL